MDNNVGTSKFYHEGTYVSLYEVKFLIDYFYKKTCNFKKILLILFTTKDNCLVCGFYKSAGWCNRLSKQRYIQDPRKWTVTYTHAMHEPNQLLSFFHLIFPEPLKYIFVNHLPTYKNSFYFITTLWIT